MRRFTHLALSALCSLIPAQAALAIEGPIADNSFLLEEAYNQEAGVVQHINTLNLASDGSSWEYGFTQEWPVMSQEHQLSYVIPVSGGSGVGLGDLMLNYRYQALGVGGGSVALAPRVTLVLPTSGATQGKGLGYEANLPLSVQWSDALVTHTNLGATLGAGEPVGYVAGHSFIWLMTSTVNPLVEFLWKRAGSAEFTVNPGVRWAHNLGETQVVPGVALPVTFGDAGTSYGAFLYLSIEHPFGH